MTTRRSADQAAYNNFLGLTLTKQARVLLETKRTNVALAAKFQMLFISHLEEASIERRVAAVFPIMQFNPDLAQEIINKLVARETFTKIRLLPPEQALSTIQELANENRAQAVLVMGMLLNGTYTL